MLILKYVYILHKKKLKFTYFFPVCPASKLYLNFTTFLSVLSKYPKFRTTLKK